MFKYFIKMVLSNNYGTRYFCYKLKVILWKDICVLARIKMTKNINQVPSTSVQNKFSVKKLLYYYHSSRVNLKFIFKITLKYLQYIYLYILYVLRRK